MGLAFVATLPTNVQLVMVALRLPLKEIPPPMKPLFPANVQFATDIPDTIVPIPPPPLLSPVFPVNTQLLMNGAQGAVKPSLYIPPPVSPVLLVKLQ